jgi:hypothetical protein
MTYDELLEATKSQTYMNSRTLNHPYIVIRSVLELHKPQEITLPDGSWGTNCMECDEWSYPCPTIRAIEKELM